MRLNGCFAAMLLLLAAAGCDSGEPSAPPGIFFPTVPIGDAYPSALIGGVIEARSGCLFISAHEESWLLLWPQGYTAQEVGGEVEVTDEDGERVGRVGDEVRLGGGEGNPTEMGGSDAAERWASDLAGVDIPERCGDLYWLVSP
ncbi:MAG TPA: hypothetical protein VI341_09360 [Actinomycetota bacterium]